MATPKSKTGIKVIVIGAGFGGLSTAIECHRQGHDVVVYEKFKELKILGDIIGFETNAGRTFYRWGKYPGEIADRARSVAFDLSDYGLQLRKWDTGAVVFRHEEGKKIVGAPSVTGNRGEFHRIIYEHARDDLGIPIHLGEDVSEYFEDENGAGIVLKSGERVVGDVVVGADGVNSKAREFVIGYEDKPKSTGYAAWRAWYDGKELVNNPLTKSLYENESTFNCWIGKDAHLILATRKKGSVCCWVLTHPAEYAIDGTSSTPGKLEDVYEAIKGWDPVLHAIVAHTPFVVDWKLLYHDPLPTWVSKKGRVLLLGDSAHPFLPTSAQGGSQAIEDATTIAVCLRRAGKQNIEAALRTHQEIRYERVKHVQKAGENTRNKWHALDWDQVELSPAILSFRHEESVYNHDAEVHAETVFEEIYKKYSS